MKLFIVFFLLLQLNCIYADIYWGDVIGKDNGFDKVDFTRPVGAYKKLMEWKLPRFENQELYQCLIYKVPHSKEAGKLFLRTFHKEGCQIGGHFQEELLVKTKNKILIKSISDYAGLHMQIIDGAKIYRLTFPQAGKTKRWKTLSFHNREKLHKKDKYLKEGDYCLKWNKDCQRVVDNKCSQCPAGQWIETLNYKECPSKATALCGKRSCGGKNQVACLKMISLKYPLTCEEALPYVVCAPMLVPNCEGTGEIICR